MDRIGVTLWVPITSKDEVLGLFAAGNKLSGDIFSAEDIGFLGTVASQTAVSLENIRLYEEILSIKTYNENVLQSMKNAIIASDLSDRVTTFNSMAEKITGLYKNECVGRTIFDVFKGGLIPGLVSSTLKGESASNLQSTISRPDGTAVPVSISTTLLKDSLGKNRGVLVVMLDQSEVKELEGRVRQADKLASLGTMAAGMAHEIKNPLSSIKVLSQLFPLKHDDAEFRERFNEIMPREINRIDRIVESLLGFARAAAPRMRQVTLKAAIEEPLSFFEDDIRRRMINVKKDFREVPDIMADKDQITQVFTNLILNAVQSMPQGGDLELALMPGRTKGVVVEEIVIRISDTGCGIPKENLKKLFDPFFTTKHGGTGLGLSIAHSVIDGHRGTITVDSEVGRGTAFTITLPVSL
jgi:PAS domain S-box-containing protein